MVLKSISNCFDRFWISFKISSAFGSDAATIGVFLKTTAAGRTASQVGTILQLSKRSTNRFVCKSINGDAFQMKLKQNIRPNKS
jgi:trans-2-enoyl-CoA reductase